MSEEGDEGLFRRWSRRKRAALAPAPAIVLEIPEVPEADLPPIEELGGVSDYTAFLQKGVSAEVQRRALARAWQSDAQIAEFRGMAEYAWDFNAPQYGRLLPGDDVAKLLQAVLSPASDGASVGTEAAPAPAPDELPAPIASAETPVEAGAGAGADVPLVEAEEPVTVSVAGAARRHGSALPA